MSRNRNVRKLVTAFVGSLTIDEIRRELILSYIQMERCQQVLRGEDVEPVTMKDNGLSSDLELFYLCKKTREELELLEGEHRFSTAITDSKDADRGLYYYKPDKKTIEAIKKYARRRKRKYAVGDEVWYICHSRLCRSTIEQVIEGGDTIIYKMRSGYFLSGDAAFRSIDELFDYLKRNADDERARK